MAFQALRLTDLSADQKAIVAKVSSSDKNVIRQFRELGLQRGVSVTALANNPGASGCRRRRQNCGQPGYRRLSQSRSV